MRTLVRNIVLILFVLVVCIWAIFPPEKKLRLGKDLRGGVSLVYAVQLKPGDQSDVLERVIDVVKERIDPTGQADISIVRQGQDRIEITMPLPNDRVKKLKAAFEDELKKLGEISLDPSQFERIMRMPAAERDAEIAKVAAGNTQRLEQLKAAAAAQDEAAKAREALTAAQAELKSAQEQNAGKEQIDAAQGRVDQLVGRTADTELAYERLRSDALKAGVSPSDVRRILALSNESRTIQPQGGVGAAERIPSARERALERLKQDHPEVTKQLENVLAAFENYAAERTRLDDPADLKRLLSGAGVLDFRITVKPNQHPEEARLRRELRERGPRNVRATDARWYKINKLEAWYDKASQYEMLRADPAAYFKQRDLVADEFEGEYYILAWDTAGSRLTQADGDWAVASAYQGPDELGKPAIKFEMNARGGQLMHTLTQAHVHDAMAVLLDDQVYTAPTLQSAIGKSGQITGNFDDAEIRYIARVLSAGAMQAKLSPEPISEITLAPELGSDNLQAGLKAGLYSLIVISAFMIVYYFGSGVIAVICLLINAVLILGLMSMMHAAFTMPGIAGVILTFGMAVDANVLIYERMREEMQKGADLHTAMRLGYGKAMSSIVDGNVTNLLHCVVLYFVGTQEIKGFAITMGIGVLTTLFCVFISRQIYMALVDFGPWKRASMLPLAIPAIDRFFHRKVDWLRLRWVFWSFSAAYVLLGMGMVVFRGSEMLDTQFRGGSQISFKLKEGPDGHRLTMTRKEVEARLQALAPEGSKSDPELVRLAESSVLAVNPQSDGFTSDQFTIKTLAQNADVVNPAIARAFGDKLEATPPLGYVGHDVGPGDVRRAPVFEISSPIIGEDLGRPQFRDNVKPFVGGVAILLENIDPPQALTAIQDRLERTRQSPQFSDTLSRPRKIIVLDGDDKAVKTAVILVRDESVDLFNQQQTWETEVAGREWKLVQAGLGSSSSSASVEVFSAAIAKTFTAQAVVALGLGFLLVGIYIWVRFGALSYALAGIIPLFHDVLTAIGLIALAQILYDWPPSERFARALGILPFRIDLNMIAALLTIVGYSLNDTVIVMDRIRENRGKLPHATKAMINAAVNQTISRTVITSGTVLMAAIVLYCFGGEGMRGFSYALIIGVVVGTYSSIAIAAPIVWKRHEEAKPAATPKPSVEARVPAPV
jgi:SecD/SecF fusion protein